VLAAVAVVAIHAAGAFEAGWPAERSAWLAVPISQWARFSVPLFMVFSGFGLAASEARRGLDGFTAVEWRRFWRRRAPRIALPFVAFTAAGLWWNDRLSGASLLDGLLRGTGDYHLYFLGFLLQGYLLWPLLRRATWPVVIGLLALQALFASPMHLIWHGRPHLPAWLIVHWAGYMALGARLARSDSRGPRGALPATLAALGLVLGEYTLWAVRLDDPGHYNHFGRWAVIGYALCVVWLWRRSAERVSAGLLAARPLMSRLAGLTFTVYLIHPWVLRAMGYAPVRWPFLPRWLAATAGAFAVAWALDRWVRPTPVRRLVGLG